MHRKSQSQFYSLPFKLAIASMCHLAQESLDISQKILKSRIDYSFSVIWIPQETTLVCRAS